MEKQLSELEKELRCVKAYNDELSAKTKEFKATCLALAVELAGKPSHYSLAKQYKRIKLLEQRIIDSRIRIDDLERWIKGIADDKQMPTYAQQSARSLLAQEYSKVLYQIKPSDRGDYVLESVLPTTFAGDAVNYVFRGRLEDCEKVRDELVKGGK
jgi:hypothetical protein